MFVIIYPKNTLLNENKMKNSKFLKKVKKSTTEADKEWVNGSEVELRDLTDV
jgi:hypothetical protein